MASRPSKRPGRASAAGEASPTREPAPPPDGDGGGGGAAAATAAAAAAPSTLVTLLSFAAFGSVYILPATLPLLALYRLLVGGLLDPLGLLVLAALVVLALLPLGPPPSWATAVLRVLYATGAGYFPVRVVLDDEAALRGDSGAGPFLMGWEPHGCVHSRTDCMQQQQ